MSLFFNKKPGLAIDIHDTDIRLVQLDARKNIEYVESIPLPPNAFKKELVVDAQIIADTLTAALKKASLATSSVMFNIPDAQCFTRRLVVAAGLTGEPLKAAIVAEASKIIPVDHESVVWDYVVKTTGDATNQTVLYVGVVRSVIDSYHLIAKKSGLTITAFDCEGLSLGRALLDSATTDVVDKKATMIVTIGDDVATIAVFNNDGTIMISSTVPFSAGYFTKSIINSIRVLSAGGTPPTVQLKLETGDGQGETVLQMALRAIIDEIKKTVFYVGTSLQTPVTAVVLAGGLAIIPSIETYFMTLLNLPVSIGNPIKNRSINKSITLTDPIILFSGAIGLGLRSADDAKLKNEINLFQHEVAAKPIVASQPIAPVVTNGEKPALSLPKKIIAVFFAIAAFGGFGYVLYEYLIKPMLGK